MELTDTKINMSKLTAQPQRVGVAIPVTRQTIIQTQGIIETIVKRLMPQAVAMLLNKVLFSTTKQPVPHHSWAHSWARPPQPQP